MAVGIGCEEKQEIKSPGVESTPGAPTASPGYLNPIQLRLTQQTALVLRPPIAPGGKVGAEGGAGDVAQCLEDPTAGGGVEGGVVHHLDEARDGAHALLLAEHAGLRDGAGGSFAYVWRGIVAKSFEKRRDATVRGQKPQPDDGVGASGFIGIVDAIQEYVFEASGFDAPIAQDAEDPHEPGAMLRLILEANKKLIHAFRGLV